MFGGYIIEMFGDFFGNNLSEKEKKLLSKTVTNAVNSTRTHITRTRVNGTDIPSSLLCLIWQEAADTIAEINNDQVKSWAETIKQKSKYWSDPKGFDENALNEYNMRLTQVESKLNSFI